MRNYSKLAFAVCLMLASTSLSSEIAGPSDKLIETLIKIESSGKLDAIGDKHLKFKAYGPLQVRQPACDDVNQRYGTSYKATDCLGNLELSITIFKRYVTMYGTKTRLGRSPTDQDYARIWNGGPNGWRMSATDVYIAKVNAKALDKGKLVARK